jgi:hypothetical protein
MVTLSRDAKLYCRRDVKCSSKTIVLADGHTISVFLLWNRFLVGERVEEVVAVLLVL